MGSTSDLHYLMRKVLLILLCSVAINLSCLAGVNVGGLTYVLDQENKTAELSGYTDVSGIVYIPETIQYDGTEYTVTSIGPQTFMLSHITGVVIPNSVTQIHGNFLDLCWDLTYVSIGTSLTKVIGPDTTLRPEILEINCPFIGSWFGTSKLKELYIGDNVTSIGNGAFLGAVNLEKVIIGKSVEFIGNGAFERCYSLKNIDLPNSLTSISNNAFNSCTSLTEILIPDAVTTIGNLAFAQCSALNKAILSKALSTLGDYAFSGCPELETITLYEDVMYVGGYAFGEDSNISTIKCYASIPPSSTSTAFDVKVYNEANLCVPESALDKYKAQDPWNRFKHLETLSEDDRNKDEDGGSNLPINFEFDGYTFEITDEYAKTCTLVDGTNVSGEIVIPSLVSYANNSYIVTAIGDWAFGNNYDITAVELPGSIRELGQMCFNWCANLRVVILPNILSSIGDGAFRSCLNLEYVSSPSLVEYIGNGAFAYCRNLKVINLGEHVSSTGVGVFEGCSTLTAFSLPEGIKELRDYFFYGCIALTDISLPSTLSIIGDLVFYDCKSLKDISLPESLENIGDRAFANCSSLKSITLPSALKSLLQSKMWNGCESLVAINVNEGNPLYSSKDGVLFTKDLRELICYPEGRSHTYEIPKGVMIIGEEAFGTYNSGYMDSLIIPQSVIGIAKYGIVRPKDLYCYATIPPECVSEFFIGPYENLEQVYMIGSMNNWNICDGSFALNRLDPFYPIFYGVYDLPGSVTFQFYTQLGNWDDSCSIGSQLEGRPLNFTFSSYFEHSLVNGNGSFSFPDLRAGKYTVLINLHNMTFEMHEGEIPFSAWSFNPPTLHVPEKTKEAYASAFAWSDFPVIIDDLSIDNEENRIATPTLTNVNCSDVFTLQGVCLKRNASQADIDALAPGIYIIGGKKVIVK